MNWDRCLEQVRHSRDAGRLVVFAGSGVSSEAGLPGWRGLLELLLAESVVADADHLKARLGSSDNVEMFLRIADLIRDGLGTHDLYRALHKALSPKTSPQLVRQIWAIPQLRGVVTTNYDGLLRKGAPPRV